MTTCKFLVSGDVRGNFKCLFQKVERSIKKCGSFAFLLCTGTFFNEDGDISEWEYFKSNPDKIPIQVYILGPNTQEEINFYSSTTKCSSINDKITFVGQSGIFTTCEGVKVGYVSGIESSNKTPDVKSLLSKGIVDILYTSQWPSGITSNGKTDFKPKLSSPLIRKLIKMLKPRYCFSGWENHFFERIPLCHADEDGNIELLTRFIGLAYVANPKEKWLYAVNMEIERKISASDANLMNTYLQFQPYEEQLESPGPSTNQEFHLIIKMGYKVVLSLAKGGLVRDHLCLTPIDHVASISQISEEIKLELNQYKNSLKQYYMSQKHKTVVFYERFYKTLHAQVNCIPVEEALSSNIKASFLERASEIGIKLSSYTPQTNILKHTSKDTQYFYVELPDGEELFFEISPQSDFPLDFAREALIKKSIFDKPERASWKNCIVELHEEKAIVKELRRDLQFLISKY